MVAIYYGPDFVAAAEEHFKAVFQKGALPDEMQSIMVYGEPSLVDFLSDNKLVKSRSEARRLMEQNGVRVDGKAVSDVNARLTLEHEAVVQVGKRTFVKAVRG